MTIHTDSRVVLAPHDWVFDLVADVERYPEFLPLWRDARILRRVNSTTYFTEQMVGLGRVQERFTTKTVLHRPTHIEVTSSDDLFRTFYIRWDFGIVGNACRIAIALDWELKSKSLQRAIDVLLPGVARTMVDAFEERAIKTRE